MQNGILHCNETRILFKFS